MRSTKIPTKRAKLRQAFELEDLLNLGSVSAGWLKAAGIQTPDELRALGSVAAFRRVAMHRGGAGVTYNLTRWKERCVAFAGTDFPSPFEMSSSKPPMRRPHN